jgi:xanthine dehydrogenase iron-sulfur cluster and FAD-binding subunit A
MAVWRQPQHGPRRWKTWLVGKPWTHDTVLTAKEMLRSAFTPLDDLRGSADYRKRLVANLFEKFFVEFQTVLVPAADGS